VKLKDCLSVFILFCFSLTNIFTAIPSASAQSILTLGEIRTTGSVFIGSSVGQWMPAGKTYPLLQNSAIKTDNGSASLYFKDGSRVDLSDNSAAIISGSPSDYEIHLSQGIIAFNINASSSLSVTTPSTTVFINKKSALVQKVGFEKQQRTLGVISVTEKGTEISNISGKIMASLSASESKAIIPGENLLIAKGGKYTVYKTQSFADEEKDGWWDRNGLWIIPTIFVATVTVGAFEAFRDDNISSPSGP